MSSRLDVVEQQVAEGGQRRHQEGKKDTSKLSKRCDSKYYDSKLSDSKIHVLSVETIAVKVIQENLMMIVTSQSLTP